MQMKTSSLIIPYAVSGVFAPLPTASQRRASTRGSLSAGACIGYNTYIFCKLIHILTIIRLYILYLIGTH